MKYRINFRVEQLLSGSIEIEADSVDQARALFEGCVSSEQTPEWNQRVEAVDSDRCEARLELEPGERR